MRLIDQGLPSATKNQEKGLAYRLRGAANLQLKQFDKASQDLTEALKLLPGDDLTQFEYGLLALQQKKYADAFEYLNKTYAKKAMSEEHGLLLVKAAVGSNNFSRAKEVGEALMQKSGNNQELLPQMAVVFLALKEYAQVVKVSNQLPESDPNKYFNLAQAYTTMEDWKNAENTLKAWQKKNPTDGRAFRMLGYVYMKINDPFNAVPQYDRAYSLSKDSKDLEMKKIAQVQLDKMVRGELEQNKKKALEDDKGTAQKPEDKKSPEKKQDTSTSTPKK